MTRFNVLFIVSLAIAVSASGQAVSPEAVTRDITDAYKNSDLNRAAELMHPDALDRLKSVVVEISSLDSTGNMAMMFTGETDPDAIAALSDQEAFVRFFNGIISVQPEIGEAFRSLDTEILGHITEGDSLAHVVTRGSLSMMGMNVSQMDVVTLKRHGDGWLALLSGDISNLAEAVRAQLRNENAR